MTATQEAPAPSRAGADSSPLDVMLTDAALGPVRRMLPGKAAAKLWARLAARPADTTRLGLRTAGELGKIARGTSSVAPDKRDRRFTDPAWEGNPVLHRLCQSYLVGSRTLEQVVDDADLDWRSEQQLRFVVQMIVDALAPSNNPFLNPAALKRAVDTGGRSYLQGARQFVQDMASRPRIPAMVDGSGFSVGNNLAVTEGAVVLRTPIFELVQYAPAPSRYARCPCWSSRR